MKLDGIGSKDRKEYADIMNEACTDDENELRDTATAASLLKKLLTKRIAEGSTWAACMKNHAENLGYQREVKNWQNRLHKHRSPTGRRTKTKGQPQVRTRSNVIRVMRRRTDVEHARQEALTFQYVSVVFEGATASDLGRMIEAATGRTECDQQTVRSCTRLLALLDQTGTTVVRDALAFIGKTLTEFLLADTA